VSDLINSGVYCFSPKIFDIIKDTAARLQSENSDLPAYLYQSPCFVSLPSTTNSEGLTRMYSGVTLQEQRLANQQGVSAAGAGHSHPALRQVAVLRLCQQLLLAADQKRWVRVRVLRVECTVHD
jgi:hypothetical protein